MEVDPKIIFWCVIAFMYVGLALVTWYYRKFKPEIRPIRVNVKSIKAVIDLAESLTIYLDKITKVNFIGFLIAGLTAIVVVITLLLA